MLLLKNDEKEKLKTSTDNAEEVQINLKYELRVKRKAEIRKGKRRDPDILEISGNHYRKEDSTHS